MTVKQPAPVWTLAVLVAVGLWVDRHVALWGSLGGQHVVDVVVWMVFFYWLARSAAETRKSLIVCVGYATAGEVFLSLIWGLYDYRLPGIPLFVPPAHALVFVTGMAIARAQRTPDWITWAVPLAGALPVMALAWTGADTMGLVLYAVFLACMVFSSDRKLYAVMFTLALALELYGTSVGNWTWHRDVPVTGWTTMNPPLAAGTFYCILDLLVVTTMNALRRRSPSVLALLCAAPLTACGVWMSFDGYDTNPASVETPFHTVSGVVDGLVNDKLVRLTLNTEQNQVNVGNTTFTFLETLAARQHYEVRAFPPADHLCAVENGVGTIAAADVTNVLVHCAPSDATLTDLAVTVGEIDRPFDSLVSNYQVRLAQTFARPLTLRVIATARAPKVATIRVDDQVVRSGTPSQLVSIPRPLGSIAPVNVEVSLPNPRDAEPPITNRYTLTLVNTPIDYIKASNPRIGSFFGYAIALSGDTLVVGASNESSAASGINGDPTDQSAPDAGAVYVFTRASGVWSQEAYIKSSNTTAGARFGSAVALAGETLIVGAPYELGPKAQTRAGAAYVFTRNAGTWSQQARVTASNPQQDAFFGNTVAISGETMAVGAMSESSNATGIDGDQGNLLTQYAGAVYMFVRAAAAWNQQAYIKASNTRGGAHFGTAVALSGDTLLVGAPSEGSATTGVNGLQTDTSAVDAGAAYVFTRSSGTWSQEAYLKASNTRPNAKFGSAVAISGDTLAIGSDHESSASTGVNGSQDAAALPGSMGATYVFTRNGGVWSQEAYIKASNTDPLGLFGCSVALVGNTLAVGSCGESSSGVGVNGSQALVPAALSSGAAYLFTRTNGNWAQQSYVKPPLTHSRAQFGSSVALSPDTLAVGSPGEQSASPGINGNQADLSLPLAGAAYVYR